MISVINCAVKKSGRKSLADIIGIGKIDGHGKQSFANLGIALGEPGCYAHLSPKINRRVVPRTIGIVEDEVEDAAEIW